MRLGFRDYFNYTLGDFKKEVEHWSNQRSIEVYANCQLRMYANLYNRDMRKVLINKDSFCAKCKKNHSLTIDHIVPITKGGKNEKSNLQILCRSCNLLKSNK